MEQTLGMRSISGARSDQFLRNVFLLKHGDFEIINGQVHMPTKSEIATIRARTEQYQKHIQFHASMSSDDVKKTLEETFPYLKNKGFVTAAKKVMDNDTARFDFDGSPCRWNGRTIKRKIQGNSSLYILESDQMDMYTSSGISASDSESLQDATEMSSLLPWLRNNLHFDVECNPNYSPLQGGGPCVFTFTPELHPEVTSVYATFGELGTQKLRFSMPFVLGFFPASPRPAVVIVTLKTQDGITLGEAQVTYGANLQLVVSSPSFLRKFCEDYNSGNSSGNFSENSGGETESSRTVGCNQPVQMLSLLVYVAAEIGALQFLKIIFTSSAGMVVFSAYKENSTLPEVIARDHGNEETANYLEDVTKRFSEEITTGKECSHTIDWSELVKAAEAAEKQLDVTSEKEDAKIEKDILKETGYLGDIDTSSSESSEAQSSDSDDDISRRSKKELKNSQLDPPLLNPQVTHVDTSGISGSDPEPTQDSNRGKRVEIAPQGDLHRKDRNRGTEDAIAGNYRDRKQTSHQFGSISGRECQIGLQKDLHGEDSKRDTEAEFNAFLVQIADEITKDELLKMRFLCLNLDSNLPRGPLEAIEEPREFVSFLRRRDIISPGNVVFLMWLLDSTGNKRLAKMVRERVIPGSSSSPGPGKPRSLPCLTTNFVGREAEVQEIITKLRTDRLRMIVIISPPGMGKTQVGISVSHSLKIREPALSVIYVERLDKLTDICGEILDRLSNRPWSISEDLISQAKRKLSNLQEDTVIVLDNTDNVQGREFDDFAEGLVNFAPKVQLLITTCEDVGFISADIHKVQLRPLEVNLSAELLQKLEVDCSEKQVKDLGELCGGVPLLLINCACLLKDGFNPEILIQELRDNPIRLLKSNAKEIYDALGTFVNKFSEDLVRYLVVLSVFPSTFTPNDIEFLFEDQLQLETVKTKMLKCTLLQKMNEQKLSLHPLLQAYCRTERESLDMVDVGNDAQRKFNLHYLKLLESLSKKFITKDSALVAIQALRDQKVNIIEALKNCFEDANDTDQKGLAIDVVNSTEVLDFVAKVLTPPKECADLYRKCCEIARTSGDKRRHAESLNSLGFRRLCDVGHCDSEGIEATLELFQEAHDIRKTLPEKDQKCQTHAHTISKLGVCHVLKGDAEKGRVLIKKGIKLKEELGVSLYTAAGNYDLGNSYQRFGDHQRAIEIWKRNTLPVYKEELGDHPWTATILHLVADSYKALATESSEDGYAEQADMHCREALQLRGRLLGFHQDTARSHVFLSDVLDILGNFQSALEELNKALEIQQELLGPKHKITTDTWKKMADLLVKIECKNKTKET